ncbi:hypothetical protein LF927_01715 [Pectobacterium polaris]|uniref:hypothetical protein n=1 Tax=Pectobacterium polaris TaxID=2042057 RepID=UPI001CF437A3|nr:hypothetical protein [Pectobacterium polaris]MCA6939908.1 hypothetical protein [Pectobacterium polaris]MCA6955525.1 hypothetical protein [Pectobacterium polaris]
MKRWPKLAQLQAEYDSAHQALLNELERDSQRGPGSDAQERRRDEYQEALSEVVRKAKQALDAQTVTVQQLQLLLSSLGES